MTDNHPLDNPILSALTTKHANLAIEKNNVHMYKPGTFIMVGTPEVTEATIKTLSEMVPSGGNAGFIGFSPDMEPHFIQMAAIPAYQMVLETVPEFPEFEYVELGMSDAKEMMELVDLTKPGSPF